MKFMFVHQQFPSQFKWLAPELVRRGHHVVGLGENIKNFGKIDGVTVVPIEADVTCAENLHRWTAQHDQQIVNAEAALRAAVPMKNGGFSPDVIIVHPGWGHGLLLKDVWPEAVIALYCEHYPVLPVYEGAISAGFDVPIEERNSISRLSRGNYLVQLETASFGISPTHWQANLWPEDFRKKITVIHDGIDTRNLHPKPDVSVCVNDFELTKDDEVVTYAARNFEPGRGYHTVIRALPEMLVRRPHAWFFFIGGEGSGYGGVPSEGDDWKHLFLREVIDQISEEDLKRVRFTGELPHSTFHDVLRISSVHIYLNEGLFLSWSFLEAMSIGCAIVSSATPPVEEVVRADVHARLIGFSNSGQLANTVCELLENPLERDRLGASARQHVVDNFDVSAKCLPQQVRWAEALAHH